MHLFGDSTKRWSDIQKKLIEILTTSIFYLKFRVNNKIDMTAHAFWVGFCSSRRPSEIGPRAEYNGAAIPLVS